MDNKLTIDQKNRTILGRRVFVTFCKEEKVVNPETGELQDELVAVPEVLHLRPIMIDDWSTLDNLPFEDFEISLIALTARKEIQWMKKNLNPLEQERLFEICKELNPGFFARFTARAQLLAVMQPMLRSQSLGAKSEEKQSSPSENTSPTQATD